MIRTTFFVLSLVCVVLVLASVSGTGYLWFSGKVDVDKVHDIYDIVFFEETGDEVWEPSDLLKKLVSEGKNFASLDG